jgi:hypothetical protein
VERLRRYLLDLEKNLMVGSGQWVADFSESFWGYQSGRVRFDLFLRGNTRNRGFLFSRFLAVFILPDYRVGCFVRAGPLDRAGFWAAVEAAEKAAEREGMHWAWLVLVDEASFPAQVRRAVEVFDRPRLGVGLVELGPNQVLGSDSYLGRSMLRHIRPRKR